MSKLNSKVAIVTGASKGIGAAIATAFGAAGASVVVNYASSRDAAEHVVQSIVSAGGKAIAVQADMSKTADVAKLFAATQSEYGRLDILVNNAGVFQFDPIEAVQEQEFHREFNTNVLGPVLAIQHAIKQMEEGGSILNISSVYASNPGPASAIYSASKAAVDVITKVAAKELGARKIRVNSILPGVTRTPGIQSIEGFEETVGKQLAANTPLGRLGEPEDIAKAAVYLASEDSAWITGETIRVSGGLQ
ncbi:MAG: glucose 1-dehydrogenase [Acidobacteriaceae bacterium]|nr:glucose 1-dehydrogenase [Acidobacteriaceae bacterium]